MTTTTTQPQPLPFGLKRFMVFETETHWNRIITAKTKEQVYLAILQWLGPTAPSREDIAQSTGIRLTSVCGRVHELLRDGVIEKSLMKEQEVVPGSPVQVETLKALVYDDAAPVESPQQELL